MDMTVRRQMLNRNEWQKAMSDALDAGHGVNSAQQLERLALQCQRAAKQTVSDWHFEQALGLAAQALVESGHHMQAARLYQRLVQHHMDSLTYQGRSLASIQTALALTLFAAGKPGQALKHGLEALKWSGEFREPRQALQELLGKIREVLADKAKTHLRRQGTTKAAGRSHGNKR
ncbi:MAG TPA: hypothetical protein VFL57_06785 [Bryobacteraceae bacterium]|nr:hypothetical protein [Bryobacteraceae bacterium]